MIEQDMHALTVKVQAIGPAVFVGLSGWNIPKLAALEASFHTLKLAVAGSGAVVLQPALTHKVCRPNSAQTPLHRLPSRGLRPSSHCLGVFQQRPGTTCLGKMICMLVQVTLGRGGVERLEVHSAPMRVPITLQLKAPRIHLPADVYFQRFHTWHYSCTVSGAHPCSYPLCSYLTAGNASRQPPNPSWQAP